MHELECLRLEGLVRGPAHLHSRKHITRDPKSGVLNILRESVEPGLHQLLCCLADRFQPARGSSLFRVQQYPR